MKLLQLFPCLKPQYVLQQSLGVSSKNITAWGKKKEHKIVIVKNPNITGDIQIWLILWLTTLNILQRFSTMSLWYVVILQNADLQRAPVATAIKL